MTIGKEIENLENRLCGDKECKYCKPFYEIHEKILADSKAKDEEIKELDKRVMTIIDGSLIEQQSERIRELEAEIKRVANFKGVGCGTIPFEGHYKCRTGNLCPICEIQCWKY
jgi:hypothetical protein